MRKSISNNLSVIFFFFFSEMVFLINLLQDYTIVGPLGRGSGSFVYKILSRKSKTEYVFNYLEIKFSKKALKVIDKTSSSYRKHLKRIENEV